MVSKASEDLPDPDTPVITTRRSRGMTTSKFLRLCWRAPRTQIASLGTLRPSRHGSDRTERLQLHEQVPDGRRALELPVARRVLHLLLEAVRHLDALTGREIPKGLFHQHLVLYFRGRRH